MIPCIIITLICQIRVKTAFSKYGKVPNSRGMTGAQAAEYVLRQNGVTNVRIEHVQGSLTDHYDPRTNVIRLSDTVYNVNSVAAVGVAAHEAGHAVQNAKNYVPNKIRGAILPVARLGSSISWILIILGFMFSYRSSSSSSANSWILSKVSSLSEPSSYHESGQFCMSWNMNSGSSSSKTMSRHTCINSS